MIEDKIAKLESNVAEIKNNLVSLDAELSQLRSEARADIRLLLGTIITVSLGLAALMALGFKWI